MLAHLITHLSNQKDLPRPGTIAYVHYYCHFSHNQDEAAPFLRWILGQLCRKADTVPLKIHQMYKYGGDPSLPELLGGLEDILAHYELAYIVIDALDESNQRGNLLKVLRDLATDQRFRNLQLLASNREYVDIEEVMEQFSLSMSMNSPFVTDDIRLLVKSNLQSNPKFRRWPPDLRLEVENSITEGAQGMSVRFLQPYYKIIGNIR